MSVAVNNPMSLEGFLGWESRQELKYEFDGFRPVAMVSRLRAQRCRARGSDLKIQVAGRIRYPDALVVCSPIPPGATVVQDPVTVFEIVSSGISYTDRIEKNRECRATPSIQRYVILEQTSAATVYSRAGDDWVADVLVADGDVGISEADISIPLNEIYEGVEFPSDTHPTEPG
jgi:Uma2 family endonuclease